MRRDEVCSAPAADALAETAWKSLRASHEARVAPWIEPHLARSAAGDAHPVHDFLFQYYSYRASHLRRWHPGIGRMLAADGAEEFLARPHYERIPGGIGVTTAQLKPERLTFLRWLIALLEGVQNRPPFYGCAGLHEWAMVYRADEVRHPRWPLRLGREGTTAVVESLPVRCSHFDAFRFFTAAARPLNRLQPTRESVSENEQPGCLHANMDLYKWAYKLAPFTPSELVADAFELARDIREIDMRASPYNLSSLGFSPIAIETESGRLDYETHQRAFSARARPLRERLLAAARAMLASAESR
jgi:hypothetical protein